MKQSKIPIRTTSPDVYKKRSITQVSNYYLLKFITSKDKFFRLMRKIYKKEYRDAYTLAQKRGLISI